MRRFLTLLTMMGTITPALAAESRPAAAGGLFAQSDAASGQNGAVAASCAAAGRDLVARQSAVLLQLEGADKLKADVLQQEMNERSKAADEAGCRAKLGELEALLAGAASDGQQAPIGQGETR